MPLFVFVLSSLILFGISNHTSYGNRYEFYAAMTKLDKALIILIVIHSDFNPIKIYNIWVLVSVLFRFGNENKSPNSCKLKRLMSKSAKNLSRNDFKKVVFNLFSFFNYIFFMFVHILRNSDQYKALVFPSE